MLCDENAQATSIVKCLEVEMEVAKVVAATSDAGNEAANDTSDEAATDTVDLAASDAGGKAASDASDEANPDASDEAAIDTVDLAASDAGGEAASDASTEAAIDTVDLAASNAGGEAASDAEVSQTGSTPLSKPLIFGQSACTSCGCGTIQTCVSCDASMCGNCALGAGMGNCAACMSPDNSGPRINLADDVTPPARVPALTSQSAPLPVRGAASKSRKRAMKQAEAARTKVFDGSRSKKLRFKPNGRCL